MQQMKKGNNRCLMGEMWHFWSGGSPEDVDDNPDYFDRVLDDIVDPNMGHPISSAGSFFRVFLGDPLKQCVWADFMAWGVEKTILETGVAKYHLLWERTSDWRQKPDFKKKVEVQTIDATTGASIRWNPGLKEHQVIRDGEVVFSSADKAEAEARLAA